MLGPVECPPVITALFFDHQTPAEVAVRYGVHRAWVYKLKAAAKPRAARRCSLAPDAPDLLLGPVARGGRHRIVRVRKKLTERGLDAGLDTRGSAVSIFTARGYGRTS